MLKSMTGFGRFVTNENHRNITIEIKSVNHKYLDFNIKLPRSFGFLEEKVRNLISAYIKRGKIDVFISIVNREEDDKVVSLNTSLAKNYYNALLELKKIGDIKDDISVSTLAQFNDIFDLEKKEEDQDMIWSLVEKALTSCMQDFTLMREREGERLYLDISEKLKSLSCKADEIEKLVPESVNRYQLKLTEKIKELLQGASVDETRVLTEVAIFADKVAVDEEIVRLRSHFAEMKNLIDNYDNAGKKLDFLIQEMNRETNTIGSKANDINITKIVVDIKAELEKMREQVQNVE